jgi:hypothetical protein
MSGTFDLRRSVERRFWERQALRIVALPEPTAADRAGAPHAAGYLDLRRREAEAHLRVIETWRRWQEEETQAAEESELQRLRSDFERASTVWSHREFEAIAYADEHAAELELERSLLPDPDAPFDG